MLDDSSKQAVATITREATELFGAELISLVLYGSAAGSDFVPGQSDLNVAMVFDKLRFEHLQQLQTRLPGWHQLGASMPLLLDRESLQRGRDVFPMELQDIKESHELLAGEDLFATLPIDWRHLRYQVEHELRGKLLRLRALYAEVGGEPARLQRLLVDSVKSFLIIMRSLIRLRVPQAPGSYPEILAQFESLWTCQLPATKHVLRIKLGQQVWPSDAASIETILRGYLADVERLTAVVDAMGPG